MTGTYFPFLVSTSIIVTSGYPDAYQSIGFLSKFLMQLIRPVYLFSIRIAALTPKL